MARLANIVCQSRVDSNLGKHCVLASTIVLELQVDVFFVKGAHAIFLCSLCRCMPLGRIGFDNEVSIWLGQ
jgi:hypothetical protein